MMRVERAIRLALLRYGLASEFGSAIYRSLASCAIGLYWVPIPSAQAFLSGRVCGWQLIAKVSVGASLVFIEGVKAVAISHPHAAVSPLRYCAIERANLEVKSTEPDGNVTRHRRHLAAPFTSTESLAFEELFHQTEGFGQGYLTGDQAVPLFQRSGLDSTTLSQIWQLADSKGEGLLRLPNFKVAMKLISLAQAHRPVSLAYLHEPCPLPTFDGVRLSFSSASRRGDEFSKGRVSSLSRASPFGTQPASPFDLPALPRGISLMDAQKYYRIFLNASFNQDLLDGGAVRDIMVKTGLPIDTLRNIWNLADTHGRGCLEAFEFIIAMFYVESVMNETLTEVPVLLPPKVKDSAIAAVTVMRSRMTSSPSPVLRHASSAKPHVVVGSFHREVGPSPPLTSKSTKVSLMTLCSPQPALCPVRLGEDARNFFVRSKLPSSTPLGHLVSGAELAAIRDGQDGLTSDEFAVAMHLIYAAMAGSPVPRHLPPSLVPPSLRRPDPFLTPPSQPSDPFSTKDPRPSLPEGRSTGSSSFEPINASIAEDILGLNAQLKPLIQAVNVCRSRTAQLQGERETLVQHATKLQANHSHALELQAELHRELSELELLHKQLIPIHSSTRDKHLAAQERLREAQAKYRALESNLQGELAKSQLAKQYVQASQPIIAQLTNQLNDRLPKAEALDPFAALIEGDLPHADNAAATKSSSDSPADLGLAGLSFDDIVAARSAPPKRTGSTSSHASCHARVETQSPGLGTPSLALGSLSFDALVTSHDVETQPSGSGSTSPALVSSPSDPNLGVVSIDECPEKVSAAKKVGVDAHDTCAKQVSEQVSEGEDLVSAAESAEKVSATPQNLEPELDSFAALISETIGPDQAQLSTTLMPDNSKVPNSSVPQPASISHEQLVESLSRFGLESDLFKMEVTPSDQPESPTLPYTLPPSLFDSFSPTFPPLKLFDPSTSLTDPFQGFGRALSPKSPPDFDQAFGGKRTSTLGTFSFDDVFGEALSSSQLEMTGSHHVSAQVNSPAMLSGVVPEDSCSTSVYFDAEDGLNRHPISPATSGLPLRRAAHSDPTVYLPVDAAAMQELLGMGFTSHQANEALAKYDNNLELATNHLLDIPPDSA
ncbi:hypothetical protein L0F63_006596 [Massospora cicadina]|nr:hypothetical protein L0F63_006596 [Massospora cicadina]